MNDKRIIESPDDKCPLGLKCFPSCYWWDGKCNYNESESEIIHSDAKYKYSSISGWRRCKR